MKETDLAYIAGIIDGEGCITVSIRSPILKYGEISQVYAPTVSVNMTDKNIIHWLQNITGEGKVYFQKSRNYRHKDLWTWRLCTRNGTRLLKQIKPYLKVKRLQAELFMECAEIRSRSGRNRYKPERQLEIVKQIRALNKRGR